MNRLLKKSFLFSLPLIFTSVIIAQPVTKQPLPAGIDSNILVVVNGKVAGTVRELKKSINNMFPEEMIESLNVWKGADAIKKYGERAKEGVIEFFLKKEFAVEQPAIVEDKKEGDEDKIFEKVEIEAAFPGGDAAWRKYLERNLNAGVAINNFAPPGQYTVYAQFIVGKEGDISDVKALTNHGFGMEQEVTRVITRGPKWTPAFTGSRQVKAYRKQPVTFVVLAEDFELSTYTLTAGKENTVTLDGLGQKPEDLDITMPGATIIKGENGVYKITPASAGRVLLTVWVTKKGKRQELGKVSLLIK